MAINTIFSERLNLLMKERGVTQTTLSEAVGITKQSISMYANAHRVPDIDVFKKICEFFEVSADYLLGLSDIKSSDIEEKAISKKLGLNEEALEIIKALSERSSTLHDLSVPSCKDFLAIDVLNSMIGDDDTSFFALIHDVWLYAFYGVLFEELKEWAMPRFRQQKNIYFDEQERKYYENGELVKFSELKEKYEIYSRRALRSIFGESIDREYELYKLSRAFEKICEKTSETLIEKIVLSDIFISNFEATKEQYEEFEKENPADRMEFRTIF